MDKPGPTRAPAAIIVSGPPGSGKTTLATALAAALHYAIMDLDTVTGPLTRAALGTATADEAAIDSPAGMALRAVRYETLLEVAAANLAVGIGVVIAAPFTVERSSPERFDDLTRRLQPGEVALLYIDAPDGVVRSRLEGRNAARDRAKLARAHAGARPPAHASPAPVVPEAIIIDGRNGISEQLAEALDAIWRPQSNRKPPRC